MLNKHFRKIVVYLSGRFSRTSDVDVPISLNVAIARGVAADLWNRGFTVLCPHSNAPFITDGCLCRYEDFLMGDLELVNRSDCLLMLKGWENSKGAVTEHDYAKTLGIPIFYSASELEKTARKGEIKCLSIVRNTPAS